MCSLKPQSVFGVTSKGDFSAYGITKKSLSKHPKMCVLCRTQLIFLGAHSPPAAQVEDGGWRNGARHLDAGEM
jgi:hypothetical protein